MDTILVANAGSSSVKFQVFEIEVSGRPKRQIKGKVEGIGTSPKLSAADAVGRALIDCAYQNETVPDVPAALNIAGAWLRDELRIDPIAVGHRVVHGGPDYARPVLIDQKVLSRLERYIPLAPLHQPHNLAPIRSLLADRPGLTQVACFDTAFHRAHGPLADHYAMPRKFYDEGVRRYGFHGLSYEYIAGRVAEIVPDKARGRVIVAHLGSGASMCALENGRSIESTMGFTALDGLPMGTRPGQLDPGVVLYLLTAKGMSADSILDLLYRDCGLKGLSGISNDMRELEKSDHHLARFAIDYFVYRVGLFAGMLAATLGGLDAFVFTAGIGENSSLVREGIASKLSWLGVALDPAANAEAKQVISRAGSAVAVYVIPTDEELMVARHTLALISGDRTGAAQGWVMA
ncbi:MAG: acetate/propionate family kinase [Rhodomicrobium sp.]